MTFEDYIRSQYYDPKTKAGVIDFSFRAMLTDRGIEIYVHPMNAAGMTTPTLLVAGNVIEWPKV